MKIVACAVRDSLGIIYSMPEPARHCHILNSHKGLAGEEQGFLTNTGHFVDRKRAWEIAKEAGQIIFRCGGDEFVLFSENLW